MQDKDIFQTLPLANKYIYKFKVKGTNALQTTQNIIREKLD